MTLHFLLTPFGSSFEVLRAAAPNRSQFGLHGSGAVWLRLRPRGGYLHCVVFPLCSLPCIMASNEELTAQAVSMAREIKGLAERLVGPRPWRVVERLVEIHQFAALNHLETDTRGCWGAGSQF